MPREEIALMDQVIHRRITQSESRTPPDASDIRYVHATLLPHFVESICTLPVAEVDAARQQRMKVVPREPRKATLIVLPIRRMMGVFVCLNKQKEKTNMARCPECDAVVELQGLIIGEITYCPDCNAELEVLNLDEPAVALAPEIEEDWGE
jgi:alpha-aminoadipate carrier protein LysW